MVSTVRPKASDTPTKPMPSWGKAAASTAAPQPPRTSHAVPMNSATSLRVMSWSSRSSAAFYNRAGPRGHAQTHSSGFGRDRHHRKLAVDVGQAVADLDPRKLLALSRIGHVEGAHRPAAGADQGDGVGCRIDRRDPPVGDRL